MRAEKYENLIKGKIPGMRSIGRRYTTKLKDRHECTSLDIFWEAVSITQIVIGNANATKIEDIRKELGTQLTIDNRC